LPLRRSDNWDVSAVVVVVIGVDVVVAVGVNELFDPGRGVFTTETGLIAVAILF